MKAPRLLLRSAGRLLAIVAVLAFMTAGSAAAQDCYVDTGGDDAQNGQTPASAKATIEGCLAIASAGDVISIEAGTYGEANVAVDTDVVFEARQTGSFTRVLVENGMTVTAAATFRANTNAGFTDGVFRLGATNLPMALVVDDGGSVTVEDEVAGGRLRIPDEGRVTRDNNATVTGTITYLDTAEVFYTDTGTTDLDITAGGELPADFNEGILNVDLGDNSLTFSSVTGVTDLDVAANTVLLGTIVIDDDDAVDIAGPGNVGSLDVNDGDVTFSGSAAVENVDIADNDDISFTIGANTLTVTGNFVRLGGTFSGAAGTVAFEGAMEDATFTPGPNFVVSAVTIDKDGGTVTLTEDITVTASGATAFSVADGTTVAFSDDQVNIDSDGFVDIDGTVTNLSTIVFRATGAELRGDGTYGDILVTTAPVGDVTISGEDIQFSGTLTLSSGGINTVGAGDDISPVGDNAAVAINLVDANQTIGGLGTFNALGNAYDLEYMGDLGTAAVAVDQEFATANITNLTFNTSNGTVDASAAPNGSISGDVTLNDAEDPYTVILPADVTILGSLTVGDGATLNGTALALEAATNTVIGTIDAGVTTTLDGVVELVGSAEDAHAAAVGGIVVNGDGTITDVKLIDGNLQTTANSTLTLEMAGDQNITGNVTLDGDNLTLNSDVDVDGTFTVNDGTLAYGANDITVGNGFVGAAEVTYSSSGGTVIFDGAGNFGLGGEALENVMVDGVALTLTSDAEITNSLVEEGGGSIGGAANNLELTGTFSTEGGAVLDIAQLTLNDATVILDADASFQGTNTVIAADATVEVQATEDDEAWTLTVNDEVDLNGTLALGPNSLDITAGNLDVDDGAVTATDGFVVMSTAGGEIQTGGAFSIANLRIAGNTTVTEGDLTVTGIVELDADLDEAAGTDDVVLADGATIQVDVNDGGVPLGTTLIDEPTFEGSVNLIYNAAANTGEEVPDDGEGTVNDLEVNAAVELQQDVEVNGTLTLADVLNTEAQGVELLLADGSTLRLEGDNAVVLAPATTVVEATDSYTLVYATGADETISSAEFLADATVTTLVNDVGDGFTLTLDAEREVNSVTLASGTFDLAGFAFTVNGDVTVEDGDLDNSGARVALLFAGGDDATIALGDDDLVVGGYDFTVAKTGGAIVRVTGDAGSEIDFQANDETLHIDSGVLDTDANAVIALHRAGNDTAVDRDETVVAHIAGNASLEVPQGDQSAAPIFNYPVGSPDGEFRPATLVFRDPVIAATEITVNHQDVNPQGSNGLPLDGGEGVTIGNYPDFFWLIESSANLGSNQAFDIELTGTDIGLPFASVEDLRIIRRIDGSATVNEWRMQGEATEYDNFIVVEDGDSLVTVRVENSQGGLVPAGSRYTLGIPTRAPSIAVLDDTGAVVDTTAFEVAENDTLALQVRALSQDQGQTVTLEGQDLPDFIEVETTSNADTTLASLTIAPGFDDAGDYTLTFSATDADGTTELTVDLTVTDVNQPPTFVSTLPDTTVNEGVELSFQYEVDDEATDTLTFSLISPPAGAEIDSTSGLFTWTPSFDQVGNMYDIVVDVTDGEVTARDSAVVTVGTIAQRGDVNGDGQISPADASLILAAVVGDTTLTGGQQFSSDVSGNGSVGAFDAGLILQCITENGGLPVEDPATCNFPADNAGKTGVVATGEIGWGGAESVEGSVVIPLKISGNVDNVYALELTADVDMSLVNLRSVQGQLPEGWQLAWNADRETGRIRVAAIGGTPISDAGTVAELVFELQDSKADVNLQGEARVNDNASVQLGSASVKEIPTEFALGENYPNPFNPTTTFTYSVPEANHVTIEVYDVSGRLVQTLVNTEMEAGRYEVRWNGLSSAGSPVASGLYMYRMQAGSFTKVKTMMLVK